MKAQMFNEHSVFFSAEALKKELVHLRESGRKMGKPIYFKLAHYLNIRSKQIEIINCLKKDFGIVVRKTHRKLIVRIIDNA